MRNSETMFADLLDSPSSSDSKSFDDYDMYGSDSDVETISMKPGSNEQNHPPVAPEHVVCILDQSCHFDCTHTRSRIVTLYPTQAVLAGRSMT
jgi:hypothetical protein